MYIESSIQDYATDEHKKYKTKDQQLKEIKFFLAIKFDLIQNLLL